MWQSIHGGATCSPGDREELGVLPERMAWLPAANRQDQYGGHLHVTALQNAVYKVGGWPGGWPGGRVVGRRAGLGAKRVRLPTGAEGVRGASVEVVPRQAGIATS